MDLSKKEEAQEPRVFINPEILWRSDEKAKYEEGCLSIPEFYEEVERPVQVRVKYLDLEGREQELAASGLLAIVPDAPRAPRYAAPSNMRQQLIPVPTVK